MKPVKLSPACKDYLWGGTKLIEDFNKKSGLDILAETWELSNHKDGESLVTTPPFKGYSFSQYLKEIGKEGLGTNCNKFEYFPVLIKFIDAKKALSIQVHPDDEYAMKTEGEYGKTELWHILDCEENSFIYWGLKKTITKEEFKERIENNTLTEVLNKVYVKKGDSFLIKSGTIHAIGEGIIICEVQQNSNTTYRVYDYGRTDKNGNTRELHIDKAIDVADLTENTSLSKTLRNSNNSCNLIDSCKYFTINIFNVRSEFVFDVTSNSFASLIITEGNGILSTSDAELEFQKGDSIFIPASSGKCTIWGACKIICTTI